MSKIIISQSLSAVAAKKPLPKRRAPTPAALDKVMRTKYANLSTALGEYLIALKKAETDLDFSVTDVRKQGLEAIDALVDPMHGQR